jgi:hypothetical protein
MSTYRLSSSQHTADFLDSHGLEQSIIIIYRFMLPSATHHEDVRDQEAHRKHGQRAQNPNVLFRNLSIFRHPIIHGTTVNLLTFQHLRIKNAEQTVTIKPFKKHSVHSNELVS